MASRVSHNPLPVPFPIRVLPDCSNSHFSIVTIRLSRAVLYCGAFHRMHCLLRYGSGATQTGVLQARGGGKEVLTGKRGGRDGCLEPVTNMPKK